MRLSNDSLRGRTVISADGLAVGEVTAIFVDTDAWRVETVQVKLRGEIADRLGADHGLFHSGSLEIPTGMVQSVGDGVVLSVPVDALRLALPGASEPSPA
jgi:sporulation protein YlmC with PRC-barrel domain